ncbi:MAG TPA: S8 family serine peptidase [Longimicrobiales bacterium]
MRATIFLGLCLLAAGPGAATAQQRPHVDPALRSLMRSDARAAAERALSRVPAPDPRRPGAGDRFAELALDRGGPGGTPRVGVLVRLREPVAAGLAALRSAGARIGTVIGDLATARVPVDALPRLADAVELERLDAARRMSVLNDSSMRVVRATEVRRRDGDLWYGSAGHGVIVGIYDTGVDIAHEDFRDGRGRSRILGLWDMSRGGTPPDGFDYGHYCDNAALTDGSCPERDRNGHGSHVLGTAAGDGSAAGAGSGYRYVGVAPAADLLVVKASAFTEDEIIDGVRWIFDTAAALGRPAVVNLSLGLQWGPRDGTTPFEQMLDSLSGPGRIIVVAAGNDGANGSTQPSSPGRLFHARAAPAPGASADFAIRVPSVVPAFGACNDFGLIELWYDGLDQVDVSVLRPDGGIVRARYGERVADPGPDGLVRIDNASGGADPGNGDHQAVVEISDCPEGAQASGAPESGTWTVRATPTSAVSGQPIHLWISQSSYGGGARFRGTSPNFDNASTLTVPGTAREVVTVGAFATRLEWESLAGTEGYAEREAVGDIAYFSSAGPTRDGRLKPEIAAPGRAVISTLSANAIRPPNTQIAPDGVHTVLQGTSMATPHVTGAIAALLQHDPTLGPGEVKSILAATARQDAYTSRSYTGEAPGSPNNQWGYGKLDVRAALEALVDPAAVAGVLVIPDADSVTPGRTITLEARPYGPFGDALSIPVVWASSDPSIATVAGDGTVTGVALGTATITATANGVQGSATVVVVPPVATVTIAPASATLVAGEDSVFVATPRDSAGQPLAGREVTWASTDTTVAQVDRTGVVAARAVGTAAIVATVEERSDTARVDVVAPSTLIVTAEPVPAAPASTRKGERISLLRLRLRVDGPEPVRIQQIGFTLAGEDPLAQAELVDDRDADAALDDGEPVVAAKSAPLTGVDEVPVDFRPGSLVIAAGDSASLLFALELSGDAPNGASFRARYEPSRLSTIGERSGRTNRADQPGGPVAGASVPASVLRPGEVFALSENPVRSDRVIFNFRERPQLAAVYTLGGARVVDLLARMETDGRVEWDLTNDRGSAVAAGIYLAVFRVAGQLITQKLIIVRPRHEE